MNPDDLQEEVWEQYDYAFWEWGWHEMCYQAMWLGYPKDVWDEDDEHLYDEASERWMNLMVATSGNPSICAVVDVVRGIVSNRLAWDISNDQ
jgi:hypothetical protein